MNADIKNNYKRFIIITTIYPPTKAVENFSNLDDYLLIVVGDKKTPKEWYYKNAIYLPIDQQNNSSFSLNKFLPYNHYARKNLGYLYAIQLGAEIIVDTDDDNIPKGNWCLPDFNGCYLMTSKDLGFVNIYKSFTDTHIWPRGFPLDLVNADVSHLSQDSLQKKPVRVGVWQGLADGDPDVDAIYRLTLNNLCYFNEHDPIVLDKGTLCPFNSQNTAFTKELFPLLYLPCFVTFRYTDILRGLIAQPIMWSSSYHLGFTKATVVQERNPHDYMKDFESEIPCYLHPYDVIDLVTSNIRSSFSIADNLYQAYVALSKAGIVEEQEVKLLSFWLQDLEN
jgi:hypothetical protein